ncbi:MAG: type I secretion protein [Rhodobacteraceae bacterium]|nr:MAG: type I secretion protein [Paracoccaceae bacterium]
MPTGYRVFLGENTLLDPGDSIAGAWTTFTTAQTLGAGQWSFTGIDNGVQYTNTLEPGTYFLGTDGFVYFVPQFGEVDTLTSAGVITAPFFSTSNVVDGTSGNDNINNGFTDAQGDRVNDGSSLSGNSNDDVVFGNAGNDTISSGDGDDTVYGGLGNDVINGGNGNDVLYGYEEAGAASTERLRWELQGADEQNVGAGFTQDTGAMNVTVSFVTTGNNAPTHTLERTDTVYSEPTEGFDTNSSLAIFGNGDADTSITRIDFASGDASVSGEVENVRFRINDIDHAAGNHRDIVTVRAFDADGNPVEVTITAAGADVVTGATVTAADGGQSQADAEGSVLVEIAGPVQRIEIDYANGLTGTHGIWLTDVQFDLIPLTDNDTINGGNGDDTIYGQAGNDVLSGQNGNDFIVGGLGADTISGGNQNDTIEFGQGDSVDGGAGDDLFRLVDLAESGAAGITLVGGEVGETDGDVLDLGGLVDRGTINYTVKQPGEIAGSVQMLDGSLLTFSGIEQIICFTPGTLIRTPRGPRPIEDLAPGDLVMTRDHGPQPLRWVGRREVCALGALAPVRIAAGLIPGATAPLLVSPQHRILWSGPRAQMLFGAHEVLVSAKHLLGNPAVTRAPSDRVTYLHLMFDRHQVIFANGMPTESFYPGDAALAATDPAARDELFAIFPELRSHPGVYGDTARMCLRAHEAPLLVA